MKTKLLKQLNNMACHISYDEYKACYNIICLCDKEYITKKQYRRMLENFYILIGNNQFYFTQDNYYTILGSLLYNIKSIVKGYDNNLCNNPYLYYLWY